MMFVVCETDTNLDRGACRTRRQALCEGFLGCSIKDFLCTGGLDKPQWRSGNSL